MKQSDNGRAFTQGWEKCVLVGYIPTAGDKPTWGWGHTGPEVVVGQSITQQHADADYLIDIMRHEAVVNKYITSPINQNMFDALVDLQYRSGAISAEQSTIRDLVNQGLIAEAAEQFGKWIYIHVNGVAQVVDGLVNRAIAEKRLFLTPYA